MTEVICDLVNCLYNKLNRCTRVTSILSNNDSSINGCIYCDETKIELSKE